MSAEVSSQSQIVAAHLQKVQNTKQLLRAFQEQKPAWYEGRKYLYLKRENGDAHLILQTYSWLHELFYLFFEGTGITFIERPTQLQFIAAFCHVYGVQEPERLKTCYHKYLDKKISYLQGPGLVTYHQIQKVVSIFCFFQPEQISHKQMQVLTQQCGITEAQYQRLHTYIMEEATISTTTEKRELMRSILTGIFDQEIFSHHLPAKAKWRAYLSEFLLKASVDPLLEPLIERVISKAATQRLKKAETPEKYLRSLPLPSSHRISPFYLSLYEYMRERMPEIPMEELQTLAQTDRKEFFKRALLAVTGSPHTPEVFCKGKRLILELVDRDILDLADQRNYDGLLKDFFIQGSMGEIIMGLVSTPELLESSFFSEPLPQSTFNVLVYQLGVTCQLELGYALIAVLEKQKLDENAQAAFGRARDKFEASIRPPQEQLTV